HTQLSDERDHVAPEPVFVRVGVRRLIDAVVDTSPEVLDEGAEQPAVDRPDDKMRVDGETCGDQDFPQFLSAGADVRNTSGLLQGANGQPSSPVALKGEERDDQ